MENNVLRRGRMEIGALQIVIALATAMLDSKGLTWTRQTKGLKCIA